MESTARKFRNQENVELDMKAEGSHYKEKEIELRYSPFWETLFWNWKFYGKFVLSFVALLESFVLLAQGYRGRVSIFVAPHLFRNCEQSRILHVYGVESNLDSKALRARAQFT